MAVVLLDFFGTLVDYDPSRTAQGYERSHAVLRRLGVDLGYAEFLAQWSDVSARLDAASDLDDHEFSMPELGAAFLAEVLGRPPAPGDVDDLVATYLAEWNKGVRPIPGVSELLTSLTGAHRLAIVTNTHSPGLVPDHLAAMGVAGCFEAIITSVEVGWRKPHPAIYRAALEALGVGADQCTFVGDTRAPDYDGPLAMGMQALLIDPDERHDIPTEHRLSSVLDVAARL